MRKINTSKALNKPTSWPRPILATALAVSLFGIAACSKKSSDAAPAVSTDIAISGALSSSTSASTSALGKVVGDDVDAFDALTLTDLTFKVTAATNPPTIGTGTVGADGSFSITMAGAKGYAISIAVFDSDGTQVGMAKFVDSTKKDLNGNTKKMTSVILTDNLVLGAVSLTSAGEIEISVASFAASIGLSSSVASGVAFDPTGVWYMKAYDGTVPTGYSTVTSSCGQGPCIGFPLTLVRLAGKEFTPNASACSTSANPVVCAETDGTVGANDKYALSIWGNSFAGGIGACGAKMGFTAAEARAAGLIHVDSLPTVSGNAVSFGPYSFSAITGFGGDTAPYNESWMKTGATSSWDMQDCRPHSITNSGVTYKAFACKAKVKDGAWPGTQIAGPVYGWMVGLEGGGCKNTATQKPVMVSNWSNLGYGTCTQTNVASTYGTGFVRNSCTYTSVNHDGDAATPAISLECSNTGGQFTNVSSAPSTTALTLTAGQYLGQPETLLANGANCSSVGSATDAAKLIAYRCYANAFWSATKTGGCQREYRFNWMTTDPTKFIDSGRGKPKEAFITNILNYSADGQTAILEDEETSTVTIATGPTSSSGCDVAKNTVLTFTKISATRLLVDLRMTGQMKSTSPACVGAAKDAIAGKSVQGGGDLSHDLTPQKMIFYVDTAL